MQCDVRTKCAHLYTLCESCYCSHSPSVVWELKVARKRKTTTWTRENAVGITSCNRSPCAYDFDLFFCPVSQVSRSGGQGQSPISLAKCLRGNFGPSGNWAASARTSRTQVAPGPSKGQGGRSDPRASHPNPATSGRRGKITHRHHHLPAMESLSPRQREWQRRYKYTVLVGLQERVRLVKHGFLLTDALFSQVSKKLSQSMRFVFLPTDAVISQRTASKELCQSTKLNGTQEYISNPLVAWTTKGAVLPVKYQRQFESSV